MTWFPGNWWGGSSGGGGGGGPVYPSFANATTADAIRDRAIAVIESLTPTKLSGDKFRRYRNDGAGDFVAWAMKNPAGAFRRFQVREYGDVPPQVSNTDYEERQLVLHVTVAYPQTARTGPDQALDRDDVMERDWKLIDYAIGLYGRQNFIPPNTDAMPLGFKSRELVRADGVDFLVLEEQFTYRRLASA
jgi:hypothetical protein